MQYAVCELVIAIELPYNKIISAKMLCTEAVLSYFFPNVPPAGWIGDLNSHPSSIQRERHILLHSMLLVV